MGEFAFIISEEALGYGVLSEGFYTAVIGAALISMVMASVTSKLMFPIIDYFGSRKVAWVSNLGDLALQVRADVYDKIHSDKFGKRIRNRVGSSYFCLFAIIIIEILFVQFSAEGQEFLLKLVGMEDLAYILFLLINFFVLAIPTAVIIINLKFIERIANEAGKGISADANSRKKETLYRRFNDLGVPFLVAVIDFTILAIVPGPFGSASSLVIIPIVAVIFLLGIYLNGRKDRKQQAKEEEVQEDE